MTRYSVRATLTYVIDLPDEDAVYEHADDLWIVDVERAEVIVQHVQSEPESSRRTVGGAR